MHEYDEMNGGLTSGGERGIRSTAKADSELVGAAEAFVQALELAGLSELGVARSLVTKFWPSHTITTYPFYENLQERNDVQGCFQSIRGARVERSNVYVHLPFCTGVCDYCAYSRVASLKDERVERYVEALRAELLLWKETLAGALPSASSLYLGGGTPTAIPPKYLAMVLKALHEHFRLEYGKSCEASPETVCDDEGAEKLSILREFGVSRVSMGVQSFSDEVATTVGRRHGRSVAVLAIENLRRCGVEDINIDLMYGLPGQDLRTWLDTLRIAADLELPSITVHQLKIKARSLLSKRPASLNGWSQRESLTFGYLARLFLEERGYTQMGVYRFVRDEGHASRHRSRPYWTESLLGVGCSSYSFLKSCTTYNLSNQDAYVETVRNGTIPLEVGRPLSEHEQITRHCIYGLRSGIGDADLAAAFPGRTGMRMFEYFPVLGRLSDLGLLEHDDGRARLSRRGLLFANEIGFALSTCPPPPTDG